MMALVARARIDRIARRWDGVTAAIWPFGGLLRAAWAAARRSIALALVMAVATTGLFAWQFQRLLVAERWLEHTDQALKQAIGLQKVMLDAETGMRGYLLSPEPKVLRPYREAESTFATRLTTLRALVADNATQVRRLGEIDARFSTWIAIAEQAIHGRIDPRAARDFFSVGQGLESMDFLRDRVNAFLDEEQERRVERSRTVEHRVANVFMSGAALSLALRLVLIWIGRRMLR